MSRKKNNRYLNNPKSKFTPDIRQRMEDAAMNDFNDTQICNYIGISRDTYYRWMKEIPGLSDKIEVLRHSVRMKAKVSVAKGVVEDPDLALKYLERREPENFSSKPMVQINQQNNTQVNIKELVAGNTNVIEAVKAFEEAMRPVLTAKPTQSNA